MGMRVARRREIWRRGGGALVALALLGAACAPSPAPAPTAAAPAPAAASSPVAAAKPAASPAAAAPKPAGSPVAAPASKPAGTPVTLKAVSTWEKPISFSRPLVQLQKVVEEKSAGSIKIDFLGGPEVVPALEGVESVSRGVFDLLMSSPAFYSGPIPEADAITYERGEFKKFRAAGALDLYDRVVRERAGVTFLGGAFSGNGFVFITKEEPKSLDFFKGKKIRTVPVYLPLVQALGGAPVTIPPAETYTALERGVADVLGWPENGIEERKIHEVAKFAMLPTFWEVRGAFLMNVAAWDKLSPDQQKVLKDAVIEVEDWSRADVRAATTAEQGRLKQAGMKFVDLPPAEAEKFNKMASEEGWKALVQKSPQRGKELQDAFQKAGGS